MRTAFPTTVLATFGAGALLLSACAGNDSPGSGLSHRLMGSSAPDILADQQLMQYVTETATVAYDRNCSHCHNSTLEGRVGVHRVSSDRCRSCHEVSRHGRPGTPSLVDHVWLWGGQIDAIQRTIQHGIRSSDPQTRTGVMPAFGTGSMPLSPAEIDDLVEYVLDLSGATADPAAVKRASGNFARCTVCHGQDGKGMQSVGGSDLTDAEWIYGGDRKAIRESIAAGRAGMCPAWINKLDPATIRALAIFIHQKAASLGS